MPFFLYGTLRPGGAQHGLVSPYVVTALPARAWGRLYHVAAGCYPALEIPESAVLADGSATPSADAETSSFLGNARVVRASGDWDWVLGDWVVLRQPDQCVPVLDDYEGYCPGGPSLYRRVLIAVETAQGAAYAWVYTKSPESGDRRLLSGSWSPENLPSGSPE
jgi:gamma-glutamylcyclotransferase (GGCT)/AIG2-like uncharacterized protein YtfP